MRRVLVFIVLLVSLLLYDSKAIYPSTMQVYEVTDDVAVLLSPTGHLFGIYADDLEVGDMVSCIMFSCFTWEVTDDIVLCSWAYEW